MYSYVCMHACMYVYAQVAFMSVGAYVLVRRLGAG